MNPIASFAGAVFAVLLVVAVRRFAPLAWKRAVVFEGHRAILFRSGVAHGVTGPGVVWYCPWRTSLTVFDVRPVIRALAGQEIPTLDGVSVRLTMTMEYAVTNPLRAIQGSSDYAASIYNHVQLGLREEIGALAIDDVLAQKGALAERIQVRVAPYAEELGLHLIRVSVKDIVFPGTLRRVMAQVVEARKGAEAAVERARGETAALRNLANAAKLAQDHPALLPLRFVEALGQGGGNNLLLSLPRGVTGGLWPPGD